MQPVHCSPSAFGLLLHRNRSLALLSAAGLPSAAPANPSQRLWPTPAAQPCLRQAGAWGESPSPATSNPSQRLWPTPASQPCLRQAGAWGESPGTCSPCSYGLPKATLGILHRLQTLPRGCKPSPAPLAYSCTAALPSSSSRQLAGLPLLFLWASKSDVRHFAPPLNPPRGFKPFPAPLAYSCIAALPCLCVRREPGERASGTCIAALPASGGSLGREPLERAARALQPQRLWPTPASQPQPCPLIGSRPALRSACKPFPAPLAYSCSAALPASGGSLGREPLPRDFKPFPAPLAYSCIAALPASGGSLGREPWNVQPVLLWASKSDVRHFAPPSNPPPRLQTLPSAFGLLLHRSLALFLFSAARRPASSLLMGFQKRR